MKMKRWLTRMVGREDWASRALRLGLEAFDRESGGASGRAHSETASARIPLEADAESVPTIP